MGDLFEPKVLAAFRQEPFKVLVTLRHEESKLYQELEYRWKNNNCLVSDLDFIFSQQTELIKSLRHMTYIYREQYKESDAERNLKEFKVLPFKTVLCSINLIK